jgi:hypothetical protein
MPEIPDFAQIALDCLAVAGVTTDPAVEAGRTLLASRFAEQLRAIWNARGAADVAIIDVATAMDHPDVIAQIQSLDWDA